MSAKKTLLVMVLIGIFAAGALTVYAQDSDLLPHFGPGSMMGQGMGMMSGGHGRGMMGGMVSDGDHPMLTAVAEVLGIDQSVVLEQLRAGKGLAELATEYDVDLETLQGAVLEQMTDHMAELVDAGTLSQEELDAHLAFMSQHLEEMPMWTGEFGGMHGMMTMGSMHGMRGGHGSARSNQDTSGT